MAAKPEENVPIKKNSDSDSSSRSKQCDSLYTSTPYYYYYLTLSNSIRFTLYLNSISFQEHKKQGGLISNKYQVLTLSNSIRYRNIRDRNVLSRLILKTSYLIFIHSPVTLKNLTNLITGRNESNPRLPFFSHTALLLWTGSIQFSYFFYN